MGVKCWTGMLTQDREMQMMQYVFVYTLQIQII